MPDYKKLYFHLFGAVADAVEHLGRGSVKLAEDCLIRAQQEAEERYLEDGDQEDLALAIYRLEHPTE